ncbi:MAG TPA: flagellar brake protein [Accumulibacter sp.]|jgi:c-di-GMP-binding flagellar brake protein YcgR|nr:flagellar brake protein [Accumulibacter sp.]HQC79341.1 flagellar brake protein [Accumulibacter sp.]
MEETGVYTQQDEEQREEQRKFEIEQPEDYGQYLLHAKAEVVAILRSLMQKKSLISAYFNDGNTLLLTSVLHVATETGEIVFDSGNDDDVNRKVLQAENFILSASVDSVKVQFTLQKLSESRVAGRLAFRAALPDKVLRLQRREFFRLATPIAKPVKFSSTIHRPDGSAMLVEASLLDISGGGIGLMASLSLAELLPRGAILKDCRMTLPDEGLLVANLCVRNKFDVTTRAGSHYVRVGCEFMALPGARTSMVQRYITRVERERKARLSGMG